MGMFDSVWAICPKCEERVEFQSKAGDCLLCSYTVPGDVPVQIAIDVDHRSVQCDCGEVVTIKIGNVPLPGNVAMTVR